MEMKAVEPESKLDEAIDELFAAWHKYREFIKRNHRDRLAGVMVVKHGSETITCSSSEKYTRQIDALTFDYASDSFSITERTEEE